MSVKSSDVQINRYPFDFKNEINWNGTWLWPLDLGFKLLFATMLWSAFIGQIGLPIVSGITVNTFRADGNLFGTYQTNRQTNMTYFIL